MLPCVDLDLQPQRNHRFDFRLEVVVEGRATLRLLISGLSEPRLGRFPDGGEHVADTLRFSLYEVDVLGIAICTVEMQLVQRRTAAEGQPVRQEGVGEQLHQSPRDYEILLDVGVGRPRSPGPPGDDVRARNHRSESIPAFT